MILYQYNRVVYCMCSSQNIALGIRNQLRIEGTKHEQDNFELHGVTLLENLQCGN